MSSINERVAASLDSLTSEYNTIAHNLANVSTAGYKRRCNAFSQVMDAVVNGDRKEPQERFVRMGIDFTQGNLVETGRRLDLAIHGDGFFMLETPKGPLYSRGGSFHVNGQGQIVDSMGRIAAGVAGPIVVPGTASSMNIHVSENGAVSADGVVVGNLKIVDFEDRSTNLKPVGLSCYQANPNVEAKPASPVIRQGYQENSNVNMMEELVGLISVTRLYEANMKLVTGKSDASKSLMSVAMG